MREYQARSNTKPFVESFLSTLHEGRSVCDHVRRRNGATSPRYTTVPSDRLTTSRHNPTSRDRLHSISWGHVMCMKNATYSMTVLSELGRILTDQGKE